jgi:hypothetical protein
VPNTGLSFKEDLMVARRTVAVLGLVLLASSCSEPNPTSVEPVAPSLAQASVHHRDLLSNLVVNGTLATGGFFEGVLSITEFAFEEERLLASGTLTYGAEGVEITQEFSRVAASLSSSGGGCRILSADLGPIFLDVLGLEVDLLPVELELRAQPGPENLLGNLLCAVATLLEVQEALTAVLPAKDVEGEALATLVVNKLLILLDRINDLLG